MPNVARLIESEGYQPLQYRCGIPSTTPFCQAGILYGDNTEIPSYRWWDKEAGLLVGFGVGASFKKVAHRYFAGAAPLTEGGAVIGCCYPAGAKDTFGLAYRVGDNSGSRQSHSALATILPFFASPLRVADWLRHGLWAVAATGAMAIRSRIRGKPAERSYVISEMLEELFLHHVARYALLKALDAGFPALYAGFYAYDETAHGFGPEDDYCYRMLSEIDETIGKVAAARTGGHGRPAEYELVVLSDHGQVETVPFNRKDGRTLGEIVSGFLPTYEVAEYKGKKHGPKGDPLDGHIALTYSGGLAHLYFTDIQGRLGAAELDLRFPGLIAKLAGLERIAIVLVRDGGDHLLIRGEQRMKLGSRAAAKVLAEYDDDPQLLSAQLERLDSFERSGDLILFGEMLCDGQVNFEHQVGGHGSIGGDQSKPFLLVKAEWGIDTSKIRGAHDVHPLLTALRDRLAAG